MSSALNAATSALQAQSKALSIISDNLANTSTTGYKSLDTSFADLVTATSAQSSTAAGGVLASTSQNVYAQGTISSTSVTTNMAINGNGLFVVSDSEDGSTGYAYTRDGEFTQDSSGYLTENGEYLMGWETDSSGNVTSSNTTSDAGLEAINVDKYSSYAKATDNVTLQGNLPADASVGASYSTSLETYDSLGKEQDIPVTFAKTAANTWTMTVSNPTNASGTQSGTIGGTTTYDLNYSSDGSLESITDSSGNTVSTATITVSSFNDGASTTTPISLNLGTAGSATGLTQYTSGESTPNIDITKTTQDGVAYGTLSSVSIATDGTVDATYSNGASVPIYKVALATFTNANGLATESDNLYTQTAASGNYTLHVAGQGGSGSIKGSSLEGSTADTTTEFSKMIQAQQAYSAASQIITTDKSMFQSLISAVG